MAPWADIRHRIPFRLLQGEMLLGTLTVHEIHREWLICACEPTAAFAAIRPLFDVTSGRFADPLACPVSAGVWATVRAALAAQGVCVATSQGPTEHFTLHIDGQKAWLRFE